MLPELMKLKPSIMFKTTPEIEDIMITTFSDASYSETQEVYGKSCIPCVFKLSLNQEMIFYPLSGLHQNRRESAIPYMNPRYLLHLMLMTESFI